MERGMRKELTGVVVSNKMEKTCVVAIQTWKIVPKYGKRVRSTRKVKAHDEDNSARTEMLCASSSRPISRDKRWRVAEIVERPRPQGVTSVIQQETRLKVADNTGAREITCIGPRRLSTVTPVWETSLWLL